MVAKPSANALPSATFAATRVMVVRFIGGPISLGMLRPNGIHYVDVGTSGGVWGLERGYCLMIGGEREIVERLEPIFTT